MADRVKRLHVVYATNQAHAPMAAVAAKSLLVSNERSVGVTFLCLQMTATDRHRLVSSLGIHSELAECRDIDLTNAAHLSSRTWHPIVYAKIFVPDMFENEERSLYLDNDTLVLRSVSELANVDMTGNCVAAVPDAGNFRDAQWYAKRQLFSLRGDQFYVNGGVMLFNNSFWRTRSLSEKLLKWMTENQQKITANEQDGINGFLRDRIMYLPIEYNLQVPMLNDARWNHNAKDLWSRGCENARIVHYSGAAKPWHFWKFHPFQQEYGNFADKVQQVGTYHFNANRWRWRLSRQCSKQWFRLQNLKWRVRQCVKSIPGRNLAQPIHRLPTTNVSERPKF